MLVTGGTGVLGSRSISAIRDAGHDVRLLVRSPAPIAPALAPHGIGDVDHVVGDVTDERSVAEAVKGCDAVLHAANVYSLDPRRAGVSVPGKPLLADTCRWLVEAAA